MSETQAPSLTLLIKLLKMTTSSSEPEALVAIRKANTELKKFGGDWEALLRGKVTVIGDPFADLRKPDVGTVRPPRASPPPRAAVFHCDDGCGRTVSNRGMRCSHCQNVRDARARQRQKPAAAVGNGGFTRPGSAPQAAKPKAAPAWSNAPKNITLDDII